ncbi:hypothetical protein POM88_015445 [Heracleum sosnowskyi]|uniref:Uncharacterized protein n=1 Tax=Heracleum sosnowskyi TaxID=360622 RepID=A0AAD8IMW3_9APIA|nr:hypothetical protein POM88_015445 [Heracleum sosnowskyi]
MASSSLGRDVSDDSGSDDELMVEIDNYEPDISDNIDKSLTNLNANIRFMGSQMEELKRSNEEFLLSFKKQQQIHGEQIKILIAGQSEELTKAYHEFNINFLKQQECIGEEIKGLLVEAYELRKQINRGV